jgi:phosphoribosylanthranilate isomerase
VTPHAELRLLIKICCISSIEEAKLALECGADLLGLVSSMPSGPGVIADDMVESIRNWIGFQARAVLLTSRTTAEAIGQQIDRHNPAVIQLCDDVEPDEVTALRYAFPGTAVMPVVHVRDDASVTEAMAKARNADALLLDSGNQSLAVKELGGTGRVHDWNLSRRITDSVDIPVFLAGGLNAGNVRSAIRTVQPAGVDVCSGVREGGILSRRLLADFIEAARTA